jgi:hypothetical protein
MNILVSLSMAIAAEVQRAEGQFRRLKSTLNKLKSLQFQFSTRWPTFSKRVVQYFEQLKTFVKKGHLGKASECTPVMLIIYIIIIIFMTLLQFQIIYIYMYYIYIYIYILLCGSVLYGIRALEPCVCSRNILYLLFKTKLYNNQNLNTPPTFTHITSSVQNLWSIYLDCRF